MANMLVFNIILQHERDPVNQAPFFVSQSIDAVIFPCGWVFRWNSLGISDLRWWLNKEVREQEISETHISSFPIMLNIPLNSVTMHTDNERNPLVIEKFLRKLDIVVGWEPDVFSAPVEIQDCLFTRGQLLQILHD